MEAVVVRGLTKTYRAGVGRARVREMLPPPIDAVVSRLVPRWWNRNTFDALRDVSLTIPAGAAIGIVGHNGAGKTTLLKLIARISEPTLGEIDSAGRVVALIDVLVGFHPELTGRENVYLLGAIHGFNRRSMHSRVADVFAFAEIDELADTPVKRYSAGMGARLGFATTAALEPDVLLIDEVLAVGDAPFQRKCIDWLDEYRAAGKTLVFVSHNMSLIRHMTERCIWLDHGSVVADGPTDRVLETYAKSNERRSADPGGFGKKAAERMARSRGHQRWGTGGVRISEATVRASSGASPTLHARISYESNDTMRGRLCVGFVDEGGRSVGTSVSPTLALRKPAESIECTIEPLPLRPGIYFPVIYVIAVDGQVRDRWQLDRAIVVERNGSGMDPEFGPVELLGAWEHAPDAPH